jgi:hypothetical protein
MPAFSNKFLPFWYQNVCSLAPKCLHSGIRMNSSWLLPKQLHFDDKTTAFQLISSWQYNAEFGVSALFGAAVCRCFHHSLI